MKNQLKNRHLKRLWATKTLVTMITIGFLMVVLSSITVSAWLSISDYKEYNPLTKTAVIYNGKMLGGDIKVAEATLLTPQINYVIAGKDRLVFEIKLNNIYEATKAIDGIEFHNNYNGNLIDRKITWKYATITKEEVIDYETICKETGLKEKNGTAILDCFEEKVGSHLEDVKTWNALDEKSDISVGEIILGGFVDVEVGDNVEWIPTLYGQKISEWATWISLGLDTSTRFYYPFDDTDLLKAIDSRGFQNGTWGATQPYGTHGLVLNASQTTNALYINTSYNMDSSDFGISMWLNTSSTSGSNYLMGSITSGGGNGFLVQMKSGVLYLNVYDGGTWTINDVGATMSAINDNLWHHIVITKSTNTWYIYIDGSSKALADSTGSLGDTSNNLYILSALNGGTAITGISEIDEFGFVNRTITAGEVTSLYNGGAGIGFGGAVSPILNISTTLISPDDGTVTSDPTTLFNASSTIVAGNLTNMTLYLFNAGDGSIEAQQTNIVKGFNMTNSTTWTTTNTIGDFLWNVYSCGNNVTDVVCSWATSNRTFSVGAMTTWESYNNVTYETASENFKINISLIDGSELSLANLVYDDVSYAISDVTYSGNNVSLSKTIDIPKNTNTTGWNDTNRFYWKFTYNGGEIQSTTNRTQTSKPINFGLCSATNAVPYINFTSKAEVSGAKINTAFTSTAFYWLGTGTVKKNVSVNDLSDGNSTFNYCFTPQDKNLSIDDDIDYQHASFSPNEYHIRNASLTNTTTLVDLYQLETNASTKFYVTAKQGITFLSGAVVNIQKYFTGEGIYKTIGIALTDVNGKFPAYLEIDKDYRFTAIYNGQALGPSDNKATCSASPCTIEVNFAGESTNIYAGYDSVYGKNIQSSLIYNSTTEFVTYNFIDTTGLANYFRLVVKQTSYNGTESNNFCDSFSYTSAGTLTCNMTGKTGDWFATGYISRSPEVIDKVISFILSDALEELGFLGLFMVFGIIVTVVIGAGVMSRGSPSTVLFALGGVILLLKIMGFLPFGWILVSTTEALIIYLLWRIKT